MSEPLVTIGIPTYNRAQKNLRAAIQGALAQDYPSVEVVVCDNASTDTTPELMAELADPRLRYIRHDENIGPNNNFNACVEHANGEYFLLLHDDDHIDPDFVSTCMTQAQSQTYGVITTGLRFVDVHGNPGFERENTSTGDQFVDLIRGWLNKRTNMYCCNTLLHTQTLRDVGGYQSANNLFQDVLAQVKVAAVQGHLAVRPVKAGFRLDDSSLGSSAAVKAWLEDSVQLRNTIVELSPEDEQAAIHNEISAFLCRMTYLRVEGSGTPGKRFANYLAVRNQFDNACPMFGFLWEKELRPALRALKARLLSPAAPSKSLA